MSRYLTNFARTGAPNKGDSVATAWPPFSASDKIFGRDLSSGGGVQQLTSFEADHKGVTPWSVVTF